MGAAMTYAQMYNDEVALKVAAVTKLTRNMFLAAVIPGLTWVHHKYGKLAWYLLTLSNKQVQLFIAFLTISNRW